MALDARSSVRIRTQPLPQVSWTSLRASGTLEDRLVSLLWVAFAGLLAIQLWLHL